MSHASLQSGFLRSAAQQPDRPCLRWSGGELTYAEMAGRVGGIAAAVGDCPRVAILADRTPTAYAGVLGTLVAGAAYVPLNLAFPAARNRAILERSGAMTVIADEAGIAALPEVFSGLSSPRTVVADGVDAVPAALDPTQEAVTTAPETLAYLMFTSGSTGVPKGVAVSHGNVRAFVDRMMQRYGPTPEDRMSQMFDLTFDLSVFDQFMAWEAGALLVCPSRADLVNPAGFIQRNELTTWFCVPSVAMFMRRLGSLAPAAFPTLRWSLFCGEPLPAGVAGAWAVAAPSSTVENLYGPTELTVACAVHRWDPEASPRQSIHGVVPIGEPLAGLHAIVVDPSLNEVPPGGHGELLVAGDQVTLGYWNDAERTDAAFVTPPGHTETFYRTGDVVTRTDADSPLCYLGRIDHQIKILGHRVELLEVEAALRSASGRDSVAAVGWPRTESGAAGVVAFVAGGGEDLTRIRAKLASRLPPYMVPRRIHTLPELPLNANGKVDRGALEALLASGDTP